MGWAAGSAVMVTSTAFNGTMEEAETVIVTAVSADGLTLTLAEPGLLYRHLGETRTVAEANPNPKPSPNPNPNPNPSGKELFKVSSSDNKV